MRTTVHENHVRSRERLLKLEDDLLKIPGIRSARVVGVATPSKIHVVATGERSAAEIAADIQTLAQNGYGVRLDNRTVSIAQVDGQGAVASFSTNGVGHRPLIDRVVVANIEGTTWIKVALQWPDRPKTQGSSPAGSSREGRAKGAVEAAAEALKPVLASRNARLFTDHVVVQQVGSRESVLFFGDLLEGSESTALTGASVAYDDIANAAVRSVLQAINRKLEN